MACLSHYHLTFTTESIHNLLKSCLTFSNKTSPLFTLWSNHTREDKTKIEIQSERIKCKNSERNLGRVQNPSGRSGGGGRGGVVRHRGWLSEVIRRTKGLYFVLLFTVVSNCTLSVFTFINPLLLRYWALRAQALLKALLRDRHLARWGYVWGWVRPYKRLMGMCRWMVSHFHS